MMPSGTTKSILVDVDASAELAINMRRSLIRLEEAATQIENASLQLSRRWTGEAAEACQRDMKRILIRLRDHIAQLAIGVVLTETYSTHIISLDASLDSANA